MQEMGGHDRSSTTCSLPVLARPIMDMDANCWKEYREKVLNTMYLREDGLELGVGLAFNAIDRSYKPEYVQAFASRLTPSVSASYPYVVWTARK